MLALPEPVLVVGCRPQESLHNLNRQTDQSALTVAQHNHLQQTVQLAQQATLRCGNSELTFVAKCKAMKRKKAARKKRQGLSSARVELTVAPSIVVIDLGSYSIKAGVSTDSDLKHIIPSVVCKVMNPTAQNLKKVVYVGEETDLLVQHETQIGRKRGSLELNYIYPIMKGNIVNYDEAEALFQHTFYSALSVDPEDCYVLLTEVPLTPKLTRENLTQIMFETFNVMKYYVFSGEVVSLYSVGKTSGLVVSAGYDMTRLTPVYEGFLLPHAIQLLPVGGRTLTDVMFKKLVENGYLLHPIKDRKLVEEIKEKMCKVSKEALSLRNNRGSDLQADVNVSETRSFKSNTGRVFELGDEVEACPEVLFDPALVGEESKGIHELAVSSIMKCDIELRQELFSSVLLCGGTNLIPGMRLRMLNEMKTLASSSYSSKLEVIAAKKNMAWFGGKRLVSENKLSGFWLTKEEYDSAGPAIIHRKCF